MGNLTTLTTDLVALLDETCLGGDVVRTCGGDAAGVGGAAEEV